MKWKGRKVPEDIESLKDIKARLVVIQAKLTVLQAELEMLNLLGKILEQKNG